MELIFLRVRPVPGRQILDPFSIGRAQHRRIGYERRVSTDETVRKAGKPEPRVRYDLAKKCEPELVRETSDGYFARAILAGDIEYVEHVAQSANGKVRTWKDPALVRATVQHRRAREDAERAAKATADAARRAADLELQAAEEGLTVDELRAREKQPEKSETSQPVEKTAEGA